MFYIFISTCHWKIYIVYLHVIGRFIFDIYKSSEVSYFIFTCHHGEAVYFYIYMSLEDIYCISTCHWKIYILYIQVIGSVIFIFTCHHGETMEISNISPLMKTLSGEPS